MRNRASHQLFQAENFEVCYGHDWDSGNTPIKSWQKTLNNRKFIALIKVITPISLLIMIGELYIKGSIQAYNANTEAVVLKMEKGGQPGLLSQMIYALAFCVVATSVVAKEPYYYKSPPPPLKSSPPPSPSPPPPYHYSSPPPPKKSPPPPYH